MSRKVFITGGAGFIGSALARKLRENGDEVTILDLMSSQVHQDNSIISELKSIGCNVTIGDVCDFDLVLDLMSKSEVVIHLASETGTGQSMYEVQRYSRTNVKGSEVVARAVSLLSSSLSKVILSSSRSVYGEGKYSCFEHGFLYPQSRDFERCRSGMFDPSCPVCNAKLNVCPTDEFSPKIPSSIYAATKSYQEDLFRSYHTIHGVDTTVFRFQNVYGPGQSLYNPYTGILSIFYGLIKNGTRINIFEDGLSSRDFIYIDDVVRFLLRACSSSDSQFEVLNLGSGSAATVLDVLNELESAIGMQAVYEISGDVRKGDIRHNFADTSALEARFGATRFLPLSEGVARFVGWASRLNVSDDNAYLKSIGELREKGLLKKASYR